MLTGIRVFSSDPIWRQILADLNACVLDSPGEMGANLDEMDLETPFSPVGLKASLLSANDISSILNSVFGRPVSLSQIQSQIVSALYSSDGLSASQLKSALGYAADTTTHAVDTAIYQLRKVYGRDFIINQDGVYKLGTV